jgi:translation initiation factor eIF-2B subunit gamma
VLLICPSTQRSAISHYLHNESTSFASLRIDLQGFDEGPDEDQGTSTILLHYAHKIQTDFILLPCDILPSPSLPLSRIMNKYRADIGADGTIAASLWFETGAEKGSFEEGEVASTAPIIWDPVSSTLLYVNTEDDASNLKTEISLRSSLISR